ncbi:hypothetical protein MC885_020947, partial [Smutsia gigantea]
KATGGAKLASLTLSLPLWPWLVLLIPVSVDTGIISVPVPRKLQLTVRIDDCYTSSRVHMAIRGSFARPALMSSPRPTISPLTSGKRLCLPSLFIRNSLTIL